MRCVVVLLVSILAVTWTPGLVSAQGLFGCSDVGSSGGLPLLGKLIGKKKRAISCYDDPPRGPGLAFYVGYLDNARGVAFDVIPDGTLAFRGNAGGIGLQYPIRGVLLAASGTIPVSKRLDILVNGSWLIPSNADLTQYQWWDAGPVLSDSTWSIRNQWWNAGAAVTFNMAGPFSAIGGFMVDSFTTNFYSPSNLMGTGGQATDEADLTVGAVIPYLGGLLTQGGPAGGLTVGMIGFPILFGDIKFTESWNQGWAVPPTASGVELSGSIGSGYFFELFAETSVNIRAMSFGIFGVWNVTHAEADMDFDAETRAGGVVTISDSAAYSGSFYRSVWVVGGKFALDFLSPL